MWCLCDFFDSVFKRARARESHPPHPKAKKTMTMPSATTTPASVSMAKLTTHRPMRQSLVLTVLLLLMVTGGPPLAQVHGLECVVCGEYNDDGTGAITPCLNYSAALVPRLRRVCPRSEHKFCIVSSCGNVELWI